MLPNYEIIMSVVIVGLRGIHIGPNNLDFKLLIVGLTSSLQTSSCISNSQENDYLIGQTVKYNVS
jgi:hypothetical protein